MPFKFDHRSGRRLRLKKPANGMVMGGRVEIYDLGASSVGVEHQMDMTAGSRTFLEFNWSGTVFRLSCHVARSRKTDRAGWFRSGLTVDQDRSEAQVEFCRRVRAALEAMQQAEEKMPPVI